jgi:hypothetical protein
MPDTLARLTPRQNEAWRRCCEWRALWGRLPTIAELARLMSVSPETASDFADKLGLAGLLDRRRKVRGREGGRYAKCPLQPGALWPAAEAEILFVRGLLREADDLLSAIPVMDRPRRDAWRNRAAEYLGRVATVRAGA